MIKKLSYTNILSLHADVLELYGGSDGILDDSHLRYLCDAPYLEMFGIPMFPTIYDKATQYMFGFCQSQCFVDGNKRTGVSATYMFLLINGILIKVPSKHLYEIALKISNVSNQDTSLTEQLKDNFKSFLVKETVHI